MALVIKDRVKETTTTTGTGTYTLAGAEVGFQSFSTIGNGNTTYYAVTYNNDWEVGIGTYTSSGTTLARTTILSSSNSNNAVNWSSGEKSVFVTQPSSKASFLDASGNLNLSGDIVVSGTVDGRDVAADGTTADNALPKAGGTMSGDIDGNGNKVLFANVYSAIGDLPSASTYHGMFAHVHGTGKGYFAHAGSWVPLANDADKLNLSGGTMTGNLSFGDSDKAIFGAGSDLEIFHNGANSYVTDNGQGKLILSTNGAAVDVYDNTNGHTMAQFTNNAGVTLAYQGATKIATTATGIDVTGNVAVSGTVDGVDIATNIPASLGTAGQVLTVNSGASAGEWADAGGGSPDLYAENPVTGTNAPVASGTDAVAIGFNTTATGSRSFAIGLADGDATGSSSFAVGGQATNTNAIAIANGSSAQGYNSVSIGSGSRAQGMRAVALGSEAKATTNSNTIAIGTSLASGASSFAAAITNNTSSYGASGANSIAMGYLAKADYRSVSIGYNVGGSGSYGISLGSDSSVGIYASSAAIGRNVQSTASNQVSIGGSTQDVRISEVYTLPKVDGTNGQVLTTDGSGAVTFATPASGGGADLYAANESSPTAQPSATGTNAIAIGDSAVSSSADGIAIGLGATHTTVHGTSKALAIGANTVADYYATAIGAGPSSDKTTASGNSSLAIGYTAKSTGTLATAIGKSRAGSTNSFAANIENNTTSYGSPATDGISIGDRAKASGGQSVAIGQTCIASGTSATAISGYYASATGSGSLALGLYANASGNNSMAIGYRSKANTEGKVAISAGETSGIGGGAGLQQRGIYILKGATTDATQKVLTGQGGTASSSNSWKPDANSAHAFSGTIIARQDGTDGDNYAAWEVKGAIMKADNAASMVVGAAIINSLYHTSGASAWSVDITANTTLGTAEVKVTGASSTNIDWVTTIDTSEVVNP